MFKIREEHIQSMQPLADYGLQTRVLEFVRGHCVVSDITPLALKERVNFGIQRAKQYSLVTEQAITTFVSLMFNVAPYFDKEPEIHKVLCDSSYSEEERNLKLALDIPADVWTAAKQEGQGWPGALETKW